MMSTPQTRRTHTKSRGGCVECKRRKIKCGEQRPKCLGCEKRDLSCDYFLPDRFVRDTSRPISKSQHISNTPPSIQLTPLSPFAREDGPKLSPTITADSSLPHTSASNRPTSTSAFRGTESLTSLPAFATHDSLPYNSATPSAVSRGIGSFGMEDMALWHQFVTATSQTIIWAGDPDFHNLTLSCDYLMHAALSVSALHLAYLQPGQRDHYQYASAQHQNLALGPFQKAMANITAENCHQLFAFSALLIISVYASSASAAFLLPVSTVSPEFTGLTNWFICLEGCRSIVRAAASHISSGPMRKLMIDSDKAERLALAVTVSLEDDDSLSLSRLNSYLANSSSIKSTTTVAEMEAYTEAIKLLRILFAATYEANDSLSLRAITSVWSSRISALFIPLVGEKRPPALAILIHYSLLLKRCDNCWFMEHRAYNVFDAARQSLPDEWIPYIQHPIRVFEKA